MESIIIIGGGAAGLMAAYKLSKHKKLVAVLEAQNRSGGRIHTIEDAGFSQPVEAGAEFIHGNPELTLQLLKEAGINYHEINDEMFYAEKGKLIKQEQADKAWNEVMKRMKDLKDDLPLDEFLQTYFGDKKYAAVRKSVTGFAEGFDLADTSKASTKALSEEWNYEMEQQYRIEGGYKKLIDYLALQCRKNGCVIHTDCCAKKISWKKNEVKVATMCSRFFKSEKAIITVPLSVLQAKENEEIYIEFKPVPQQLKQVNNIGFGSVIKIIVEFNESFRSINENNAGFILMKEKISTWWTQLPVNNTILTGWIGGTKAMELKDLSDELMLDIALQSLANAFAMPKNYLQTKLVASKVINWFKEPATAGGYSYNFTESSNAKKILRQSVEDTLFFAGEAVYDGTQKGTVEAALITGKNAAAQILNSFT